MRVKVTTTQANQTRWKKKDGLPPRLFAMPLSNRTPYTCRNNPGDTNRVLSRACFKEVSLPKSHSVDSAWLAITLGVSYIDSEVDTFFNRLSSPQQDLASTTPTCIYSEISKSSLSWWAESLITQNTGRTFHRPSMNMKFRVQPEFLGLIFASESVGFPSLRHHSPELERYVYRHGHFPGNWIPIS